MAVVSNSLTEQEWLDQNKNEAKPTLEVTINKFMIDYDLTNNQMAELLEGYIERIKPNKNAKC